MRRPWICLAIPLLALAVSVAPEALAKKQPFWPEKEAKSADKGPYPWRYEQAIQDWVNSTFYDPDSAKVLEITKPTASYRTTPYAQGHGNKRERTRFGWEVMVRINGKNRMGGYVGEKCYVFFSRNGSSEQGACPYYGITPNRRAEGDAEYEKQWSALDARTRIQLRAELGPTDAEKVRVSYIEELLQLKALLDQGVLTQEEFDEKKAEILAASRE